MSAQQSSLNDLFRFIRIRSPHAGPGAIGLLGTQYSGTLQNAHKLGDRQRIADQALASDRAGTIDDIGDLHFGNLILTASTRALATEGATLRQVLEALPDPAAIFSHPQFERDLYRLSDTLLLSRYATAGVSPRLDSFRQLYVLYSHLRLSSSDAALLDLPLARVLATRVTPAFESADEVATARIAAVGVADLLVVKQHIKRYEATEIAHIENVMSGETRTREHRSLERIEETLTTEKEKIVEREKELETSERFELNKEASKTLKEDQKYAFDLSVSAKYGPTVEIESSFGMDIETSTENSAKSASKYAKDVIERSLERVSERVREQRIRTILRETEEKNLHSFINADTNPHKVGIYQFLDKVYEAQVFNYGRRQMFDLIVPEPAAYLWHLNRSVENASASTLPEPPPPLTLSALELRYRDGDSTNPNHYTRLAQRYGAAGLVPPPRQFITATASFQNPAAGSPWLSEEGNILSAPVVMQIAIEPGYHVRRAQFYCMALSDDSGQRRIPFSIGAQGNTWVGTAAVSHGRLSINQGPVEITFGDMPVLAASNSLVVTAMPYETANYTLSAQITCEASESLIEAWKLSTFDQIRAAYLDRMMEYKDELAKIQIEQKMQQQNAAADFGIPPSKRKQLMHTELKKHCIAMFMRDWFTSSAVTMSGAPPRFDFDEALAKGNVIRFLEQAIEWNQLQYALYPYFWAQSGSWAERINKDDADYEFQQFMQAGAARVVLPVRPKFEEAFNYFLETGEVWHGSSTAPALRDPLYVSIVDELRELAGGTLEEPEPVGDPWEVRLPTNLVLLRESPDLPAWEKAAGTTWDWHPRTETETE